MLWLGGFLALDLTTRTPDALCPPLEEARAAVKARVGEVRGDYHAEFALIRADDGQQKLDLSLREGNVAQVARDLGFGRPWLYQTLKRLAIDPDSFRKR